METLKGPIEGRIVTCNAQLAQVEIVSNFEDKFPSILESKNMAAISQDHGIKIRITSLWYCVHKRTQHTFSYDLSALKAVKMFLTYNRFHFAKFYIIHRLFLRIPLWQMHGSKKNFILEVKYFWKELSECTKWITINKWKL